MTIQMGFEQYVPGCSELISQTNSFQDNGFDQVKIFISFLKIVFVGIDIPKGLISVLKEIVLELLV